VSGMEAAGRAPKSHNAVASVGVAQSQSGAAPRGLGAGRSGECSEASAEPKSAGWYGNTGQDVLRRQCQQSSAA
jgi:hypothetical protein